MFYNVAKTTLDMTCAGSYLFLIEFNAILERLLFYDFLYTIPANKNANCLLNAYRSVKKNNISLTLNSTPTLRLQNVKICWDNPRTHTATFHKWARFSPKPPLSKSRLLLLPDQPLLVRPWNLCRDWNNNYKAIECCAVEKSEAVNLLILIIVEQEEISTT